MNEVNIMNKVNTMNEVNIMNKVNTMNEVNIIKRIWTKGISVESDISIDIWDSGSHIYERWPDGDVCWKVISRELVESGYSEVLQKMPEWFSPGQVLHRKQLALIREPLQRGQWKLKVSEQVLEPVESPTLKASEMAGMEGKISKKLLNTKYEGHGKGTLQNQKQPPRLRSLHQTQRQTQRQTPPSLQVQANPPIQQQKQHSLIQPLLS